jgi:tRNA modification GTPase
MMDPTDTIAAIATPVGEGGIGIVRLSGPGAVAVAYRVFAFGKPGRLSKPGRPGGLEDRRLVYGRIIKPPKNVLPGEPPKGTPSGEPRIAPVAREAPVAAVIDDGFITLMKGPRSYTGEDVVELYCHGGALVLKRVLAAVLASGARAAEPGEFTKRAFLNNKMDLAQAEAVIDVIRAGTDSALVAARERLRGGLSEKVNAIKGDLVDLLAGIEAELDFPEEEDVSARHAVSAALPGLPALPGSPGMLCPPGMLCLEGARVALTRLLDTYDEGSALKHGVGALILGRPNTGKSSLLNILLKEERAIVTTVPGTTRDVIEEAVNIRGLVVRLMDTAGLRETTDFVESLGVKAALARIEIADVLLFVIDTSEASKDDLDLLASMEGAEGNKKVLVVANKVDLIDIARRKEVEKLFEGRNISFVSALTGTGLEGLEDALYVLATGAARATGRQVSSGTAAGTEPIVASLRHSQALEGALDGVLKAGESIKGSMPNEFVAVDLRRAINRLGEITGEVTTEDILDKIFSEFCIGK